MKADRAGGTSPQPLWQPDTRKTAGHVSTPLCASVVARKPATPRPSALGILARSAVRTQHWESGEQAAGGLVGKPVLPFIQLYIPDQRPSTLRHARARHWTGNHRDSPSPPTLL